MCACVCVCVCVYVCVCVCKRAKRAREDGCLGRPFKFTLDINIMILNSASLPSVVKQCPCSREVCAKEMWEMCTRCRDVCVYVYFYGNICVCVCK